jgi:C4-type Zn-finger protein
VDRVQCARATSPVNMTIILEDHHGKSEISEAHASQSLVSDRDCPSFYCTYSHSGPSKTKKYESETELKYFYCIQFTNFRQMVISFI